jgi:hypothetical protein
MKISTLNAFCRGFDLIFIERIDKKEPKGEKTTVYKFLDPSDKRVYFTESEIKDKVLDLPVL